MKKHLIVYVIWNKVNSIEWLCDGILHSFPSDRADILFVIDDDRDGTGNKIKEVKETLLNNYKVDIINASVTQRFPCTSLAMKYFLGKGYISLITPQDDQKIIDVQLLDNIENIIKKYGKKLGVIGLRDGFEYGYQNMISSQWSESVLTKVPRLEIGETKEVELLNDGGFVFTESFIKKVGYPSDEMKVFYIEDEYCARAKYIHGLINIVLGNNLIHMKYGGCLPTENYGKNIEIFDLAKFNGLYTKYKC